MKISACVLAWVLASLLSASPPVAHAQDKPASGASAASDKAADKTADKTADKKETRASRARARKAKRARDKAAAEVAPAPSTQAAAPTTKESKAPAPPAHADASALSQDNVRKEGDTEVKTLEFSGLDIDGELKTPQLLYFLTRLRAEFGRPRLPHRSFMPELSRSTAEKALR